MTVTRQWVMARRPQGAMQAHDFELTETHLPPLQDGQVLIRTIYLSIDPTIRLWMCDVDQHAAPLGPGDPVRSFVYGRIVDSRQPGLPPGTIVRGMGVWAEHCILAHADPLGPEDDGFTLQDHATVLGPNGMTAYFGLLETGRPVAGETVAVTAAAGAVGSLVGQIAKLKGCRAVGIAGGPDKCALLTDRFGFDAAVDYKADTPLDAALAAACPQGIDVGFENVGGHVLDAVLAIINDRARIVLCGFIGSYDAAESWQSVSLLRNVLMRRARMEGFLISTYWRRMPEGVAQMKSWIRDGLIVWDVEIKDGLDQAPGALRAVLEGRNRGKILVRLAPDPWA